jgi:hypothetical protein
MYDNYYQAERKSLAAQQKAKQNGHSELEHDRQGRVR